MGKRLILGALLCGTLVSALAGCTSEDSKNSKETTKVSSEATTESVPVVTDDITESDSEVTGNTDYKTAPWILSRALSDAEFLECPSGTTLYGVLSLPITKDNLLSAGYRASGERYLTDVLDKPVNEVADWGGDDVTFFDDDSITLPNLDIYGGDATIGDTLDSGEWELSDSYMRTDSLFSISEDVWDSFASGYEDYVDDSDVYVTLDALAEIYGAPNYVGVSSVSYGDDISYFHMDVSSGSDEQKELADTIGVTSNTGHTNEEIVREVTEYALHPEKSKYEFTMLDCVVGWQFKDFGIAVQFNDTARYNSSDSLGVSGYVSDADDGVFYYIPIERGTIEESFYSLWGNNLVNELISEKQTVFGDVDYVTADDKLESLVESGFTAMTATEAATENSTESDTASVTSGNSNWVDVDRDFTEDSNDNYMHIVDVFRSHDNLGVSISSCKGVFKAGDKVYVSLFNDDDVSAGKVAECTIVDITQNRKSLSQTEGDGSYEVIISGIDYDDVKGLHGGCIIK